MQNIIVEYRICSRIIQFHVVEFYLHNWKQKHHATAYLVEIGKEAGGTFENTLI